MSRSGTRHLGLDLGGTFTKWAVVADETDGWAVLDRGQEPTPAAGGPDAVVPHLAAMAARLNATHPRVSTLGIGVPGRYDPGSGEVRLLPNLPGPWAGRPLAREVGEPLGLSARLVNDARAFGLAELRLGAGRGASSIVGLTIGTGVGGVVAIDGRVLQGRDGAAGELGHQSILPDGPPCGCGSRGCLEALVRAEAIAAACKTPSAEEAIARARAGDRIARAGLGRVGGYLGIGIANLVTILTPDRVLIGGGLAPALDLLGGPIRAELAARVRMTDPAAVDIVPAELGTWSGAIGAALHAAGS